MTPRPPLINDPAHATALLNDLHSSCPGSRLDLPDVLRRPATPPHWCPEPNAWRSLHLDARPAGHRGGGRCPILAAWYADLVPMEEYPAGSDGPQ